MVESRPAQVSSLYVHVPFCARKCSYCAFYSETPADGLVDRYVSALILEIEQAAHDLQPETIFFGGGTPSLLNLRQWQQIFEEMDRFGLLGAAEWTVECNPATVSLDKARLLRDAGVNRISMGVQSLDEALLDRLGRVHSREMVFKSFDILRRAGFENVNLDLMFAIPGQTLETWSATLAEAIALQSEHLSSYEVIYEDDTPLFSQLQAGEFAVDEDLACAMYDQLLMAATRAGLIQYEVANFARHTAGVRPLAAPKLPSEGGSPVAATTETWQVSVECNQGGLAAPTLPSEGGSPVAAIPEPPEAPSRACLHNLNYWRGGSFYGLGPSATSYVRGVRWRNGSNTQIYCQRLQRGRSAADSREELPPLARAGETAAFGLRVVSGVPFEQFRLTTGLDLRVEWAQDMRRLENQGWGRVRSDRFQLTSLGLRFADAAAELFLR